MSTMTGDRYGLADKAVWRVGYAAMQLAGDVLLIPGASSRDHLAENLAVGSASLQDDEMASLRAAFGP
jgi:aryl-alcohol dehydrogenase-like predicted oxidoreductase